MNVKEYLNQAYNLHQEIQHKKAHLLTLQEIATSTSSNLSDMSRAASPDPQRIEGVMAKVVDLEREIAEDEKRLVEVRRRTADFMAEVTDTKRLQVLMKRYLEYKEWPEIWTELGVGERWAHRQHDRAIEEIEKNLHRPAQNQLQVSKNF